MQLYSSLKIVACESRRKDTSMKQQREKPVEILLLTVPQAARALGLGRTKVYELIATGSLPTVRFGRSVRVPVAKLQEWLEHYSEQHIA
jgi:excisionase family DNA binding protein